MAEPKLIDARWAAGYPVTLADGRVLNPGDVHQLTKAEAEASDNWHPVKGGTARKDDE